MSLGVVSGSVGHDNLPARKAGVPGFSKAIIPGSLVHMFSNDLWVRRFVLDCADIFGLPSTSNACMSSKDKFMFAFGIMNITTAMRRMDSTWRGMHKKINTKDAAWEFCRRFYEKYDELVVPSPQDNNSVNRGIPMNIAKKLQTLKSLPSGSVK